MFRERIPDVAVKRLPVYLRVLKELLEESVEVISSAELARRTGFSSEQIRKDLAYFGAFGTRGVGYSTESLTVVLRRILGLTHGVRVIVVGAGHLGTAIARHNIQQDGDVVIAALFDNDPAKVGQTVDGVGIFPMERLSELVQAWDLRVAVLAVPAHAAQLALDQLVEAGIEAVLNFAPVKLNGRGRVYIQNIDLTIEIQTLAYYVTRKLQPEKRPVLPS